MAGPHRLHAAHEERPAGPQHHRGGERELQPVRQPRIDPVMRAGEMAAHFQHHHRQRQRQPDPEPTRHVEQFGIGRIVERHQLGLERHAADRAGARADLADFRVHRAGEYRAFGHVGRGLALGGIEIAFRIGGEFAAAARRAEVIGMSLVVEMMRRGGGIDPHAAHRIDHFAGSGCGRRGMMMVMMVVTCAMTAAAGARRGLWRHGRLKRYRLGGCWLGLCAAAA